MKKSLGPLHFSKGIGSKLGVALKMRSV